MALMQPYVKGFLFTIDSIFSISHILKLKAVKVAFMLRRLQYNIEFITIIFLTV